MTQTQTRPSAREKLLAAAVRLVREKGYDGTSVDSLCDNAGVTKGAFFYHFKSKDELAVASTQFWTENVARLFAKAEYNNFEDPLDQLICYVDFRIQLVQGSTLPECTCLLGTMVQEKFETSPDIRDACYEGIRFHAAEVGKMIAAAKVLHAPNASWSAENLALYTQAVIQGAFVLAKAKNDTSLAADMILHLRRYIELLFHHAKDD